MAANYSVRRLDNRREQRSCSLSPVKIKVLDKPGNHFIEGHSIDISSGGIGIMTYFPLPIGTRVSVNMGGAFSAFGEVVNVHRSHWGKTKVRMGIRYTRRYNDMTL